VEDQETILIRFHKDVSFLQKSKLVELFSEISEGKTVMIDGSNVFVDEDIIELIEDFMKRASSRGITVILKKSSLALTPLFKMEVING
jgi:MFS superfamily sulfate permease-like transporter